MTEFICASLCVFSLILYRNFVSTDNIVSQVFEKKKLLLITGLSFLELHNQDGIANDLVIRNYRIMKEQKL
jgi:hypothetical protein